MRWLYPLIFMAVAILPLLADKPAAQAPTFTKLKDALSFIDHALDVEDWNGLNQALYPFLQPDEHNRNYWMPLKGARGQQRLINIFADREFPTSDNTYVIGVPFPPALGGSRIKFIKSGDQWYLNAVYAVR